MFGLGHEVGHEQVFVAVVVDIAGHHSHACLRCSLRVDRCSRQQSAILEALACPVDPEQVGHLIVGDVEVEKAVAVDVGGNDAEPGTRLGQDAERRGDVLEGAGAVVAIEAIGLGAVALGSAVVGPAVGRVAALARGQAVVDVVDDVEIEIAVAVVVEEAGTDRPALSAADARPGGDILEGAIAAVAPQLVGAEVGEEDVDMAVAVDVTGRDAHAVAGGVQAARCRDVGETQLALAVRQLVAVETVGPEVVAALRRSSDRRTLNQVEIEVAVVVVVEERATRAHHLVKVELAGHAVPMHEVEADRGVGLDEQGRPVVLRCQRPHRLGRQTEARDQSSPHQDRKGGSHALLPSTKKGGRSPLSRLLSEWLQIRILRIGSSPADGTFSVVSSSVCWSWVHPSCSRHRQGLAGPRCW